MQRNLGFDLLEVDVTFRPDIIKSKGIRSVPVVEFNKKLLTGHSTSAQLAKLLTANVPQHIAEQQLEFLQNLFLPAAHVIGMFGLKGAEGFL
ncbi:MAG: hypothetical protein GWP06_02955 [Actinobacteria bacterium]|nr:hypothetical protein [Actinomycetota bacterium]